MARLVAAACPKCGAPVQIPASADHITCHYCATSSLIERKAPPPVPPGYQHAPVIYVAPQRSAFLGLAIGGIVALMGFAGVAVSIATSKVASTTAEGLQNRALAMNLTKPGGNSPSASLRFADRPLLGDVNGDEVADIIGKTSDATGASWLGAYDGRTGSELWRTEALSKDATQGAALRTVSGDRVIAVDALGKIQAFDVKTGKPAWSGLLSDTTREVCEGEGWVQFRSRDDEVHVFDIANGKRMKDVVSGECRPLASSADDHIPGYRMVSWSEYKKLGLPSLHGIDGLSAHRALVPHGGGVAFMLGARSKGSRVAMVAAVDGKKVLWKELVPAVDPLTTSVNVTTQIAAIAAGKLVVPYDMRDSQNGVRMACLDAATGKRLWDVEVHRKSQVVSGISATDQTVYFATWSALYALKLDTGELRYRIGRE